jgi:hypothetical protein
MKRSFSARLRHRSGAVSRGSPERRGQAAEEAKVRESLRYAGHFPELEATHPTPKSSQYVRPSRPIRRPQGRPRNEAQFGDLTGQSFGLLVATSRVYSRLRNHFGASWHWRCANCHGEGVAEASALTGGRRTSCGRLECLRVQRAAAYARKLSSDNATRQPI